MAVDVKQLRIGSHILVDGVKARVSKIINPPLERVMPGIGLLHFNTVIDGNICECSCPVCADGIEPIAITPELLKELGFKFRKNAGGSWCISDKKGGYFYATVCSDSTCIVTHYPDFGFQSRVVCTYLHELEAFAYLISQTELIPD